MEMKFEKVYHPCVTLAKKRYAGFKFEKETETGELECKGIETVRRDNFEALRKIQDQSLRILFLQKDLSAVKRYLRKEWAKIERGQVELKDFLFAKEVKVGGYASMASISKGAVVTQRQQSKHEELVVTDRERVQYLIVRGQEASLKGKMT